MLGRYDLIRGEEYLSQRKRFERDEICTIYGVYIEKNILQAVRIIGWLVNVNTVMFF